jgi:hypothetical protein
MFHRRLQTVSTKLPVLKIGAAVSTDDSPMHLYIIAFLTSLLTIMHQSFIWRVRALREARSVAG